MADTSDVLRKRLLDKDRLSAWKKRFHRVEVRRRWRSNYIPVAVNGEIRYRTDDGCRAAFARARNRGVGPRYGLDPRTEIAEIAENMASPIAYADKADTWLSGAHPLLAPM